jgi:16S rRNA (guanine(966)-N(2))-methyltransferase RsmD
MIKIISGKYKNLTINTSIPNHQYKQTTSKVKLAFINALKAFYGELNSLNAIDICCGSGNCGIELLSNEIKNVLFIDKNKHAIQNVKKNLQTLTISANYLMIDATRLPYNNNIKYDVVFCDPPYREAHLMTDIIQSLTKNNWLNSKATIWAELPSSYVINFPITKQYKHGGTTINLIQID